MYLKKHIIYNFKYIIILGLRFDDNFYFQLFAVPHCFLENSE